MSRKTRTDSKLDGLPPNQKEVLERWLFEENLGYKEALARLWQDFSVRSSRKALGVFYQRVQQERMLEKVVSRAATANAVVKKFDEHPADTYRAVLDVVGQIALGEAMKEEAEVSVEKLFDLTRLMIAAKKEETRQEVVALDREKFEDDASARMMQLLREKPEVLKQLAATVASPKLSESQKITAIRQRLFGVLPASQVSSA